MPNTIDAFRRMTVSWETSANPLPTDTVIGGFDSPFDAQFAVAAHENAQDVVALYDVCKLIQARINAGRSVLVAQRTELNRVLNELET